MKTTYIHRYALAALLAGSSGAVFAEEYTPTPEQLAGDAAQAQLLADLANLDRFGAIAGIVAIWENEGAPAAELTAALNNANDGQLLDIQKASSLDEVRAILQGREAPVSLEGIVGTEQLGDLKADLVFTPVVPCRFFDTRFDSDPNIGHSTGPATTKSYYVYGTVATMQSQGGSVACNAPQGEPVGIHANFTAVPLAGSGKGNIRVWPYGGSLPNVSLVNYEAGVNIANTASVSTCYLCVRDLYVTTTFFASDQVGDVMGYYYPARQDFYARTQSAGNSLTTGTCTNIASLTVFPDTNGYWDVTAHIQSHIDNGSATGYENIHYYLSTSPTSCTNTYNAYHELYDINNHETSTVSTQYSFYTAGSLFSEVFYLNALPTTDVGLEHMRTDGETMHATFSARP